MSNMTSKDQQSFPLSIMQIVYLCTQKGGANERGPFSWWTDIIRLLGITSVVDGNLKPHKAIPPTILDIMSNAIRRTLDMVQEKSLSRDKLGQYLRYSCPDHTKLSIRFQPWNCWGDYVPKKMLAHRFSHYYRLRCQQKVSKLAGVISPSVVGWKMLDFHVHGAVTNAFLRGSSLPRLSQILKITYSRHVYTKAIRSWLLRILEISSVESVTAPCFRYTWG